MFGCLSFTPSLLPRSGLLQGLICGIDAAIGYGVGLVAAWAWRAFADREPRTPTERSWRVFGITAAVVFSVSFGLGLYWQAQIRALMEITEYSIPAAIAAPFVALGIFWLLLRAGRGSRNLYLRLATAFARRVGPRAARAVGWFLAVVLIYLAVTGLLLGGLAGIADRVFAVRDTQTEEGVVPPTSDLRSGGTDSLVPWDTLGRQGRKFSALGPTEREIAALLHKPAKEPIRTYAGLASAPDSEARAKLAVDDLERAGGFKRANLLVVTTTGSGWVDPALIDSFEYLSAGDSAAVGMQYSYLPSWISYLVDQSKAREAGRALFDAVYDRWSKLPQATRPNLYVAGESLGSFGGETAFSGEYDLRNRTSGTLFVGPPNFNTLFTDFREHRDPGSPEVEPVYRGGRTVRFANDAATRIPPGTQWDGSRVLYLMHSSDPIVWWSPNLIFDKPDWIGERQGTDVLDSIVWMPFVTFWQITADLPFSTGVPGGHGHKYTSEQVDAWATVLRTEGLSPEVLDAVRAVIAEN